jgi:signal transduction histidine kinase
VSTQTDPGPALAPTDAAQVGRAVQRWLRPLGPAVLAIVVWAACFTEPRPGLSGRHLAVSLALAALVLGGAGAVGTVRVRGPLPGGCIAVLLASSVTLVWLQPDGVAIAGGFVGLSLLALRLRRHISIPLTIAVLALVGVGIATGQHDSVVSALLNVILLGAFYGMVFLALRLGEVNDLANRLLTELADSRAEAARAAGLAERQRLAREMHDVLAHSLSGLMLQLEGARLLALENPADPRLPGVIARAHHLGRAGLAEARRAIGTLRDDDLPGPDRLPALAAEFEHDRGIPCHVTLSGTPRPLPSQPALAVYRVAQEALTNVTKHASPERVEIRLTYQADRVRLTVEDIGTNAPERTTDGYGLTGMRERAALLGGTLTTSATPAGFRVELAVPA